MAYILLALGVLMSLVGLAAMITGYPMIEIERGWATVITGAVLLSGGLIVVALGYVVRNLIGLRNALSAIGPLPASAEVPATQAIASAPMIPPPMADTASPVEMSTATRLPPATFDAGPAPGVAVPAAMAALAAGALHERDRRDTPNLPETWPVHEPLPATLDPEPHAADPHGSEALDPAANVPEVRAHDPEPMHHEPVEARGEPDHSKSDGDWLDQAFSAFDAEMTNGHRTVDAPNSPSEPPAKTEPLRETAHDLAAHDLPMHEPQMHEPPMHEPQMHETTAREPEPDALAAAGVQHHGDHQESQPREMPAEAPATAPAEPAADLAVIGRYDSEGTSYVMYSDGSIEAQSEAGIYRFGSMAELKAFIEN